MTEFVSFKEQQPTKDGYYLILYLHKDGKRYHKAIWWNDMYKVFQYKDYVREVHEYIPRRYDYYVPCSLQDDTYDKTMEEPIQNNQ